MFGFVDHPPQPVPARANSPPRPGLEETWEASISIGPGSRGAAPGRAWGENLAGGSSRHLARVTAPFPAIHRLYITSPAAFLLGWSPFAQLEASVRCSSPLFSTFLCRCSSIEADLIFFLHRCFAAFLVLDLSACTDMCLYDFVSIFVVIVTLVTNFISLVAGFPDLSSFLCPSAFDCGATARSVWYKHFFFKPPLFFLYFDIFAWMMSVLCISRSVNEIYFWAHVQVSDDGL